MDKVIKALKDQDYRDSLDNTGITPNAGIVSLDDEMLQSISGGCCLSTPSASCVPPGQQCP